MLPRLIKRYITLVSWLEDLPPLLLRLILAYGFYEPAYRKVSDFNATVAWFRDSLQLPFPELNAYMATATEVIGILLIFLGLGTRFIAVPMIVVMIVAIKTVHWANGFACTDQGYEIPFYFMVMLFSLVATGPGRISCDWLINRWYERNFKAL